MRAGARRALLAAVALCVSACGRGEDEAAGAPADAGATPPVAAPWPTFTDVSAEVGLDFQHVSGGPEQLFILESMTGGGAFLDYDSDGWLDIFAVDATRFRDPPADASNRLFRNVPIRGEDGSMEAHFHDVTAAAKLTRTGWGMGAATGDTDGDGDVDLYVTYWGPNALYRNEGDGTFADVTRRAGVGDERWGASAAFGDPDADGDLDLYVANYLVFDKEALPNGGEPCTGYKGLTTFCGPFGMVAQSDVLYRNEGDDTFTDVSEATGVASYRLPGLSVVFTDTDGDGDEDLYVANDSEPNLLLRNDGDWRFTEIGAMAGVAYSGEGRAQASMGIDAGDYDNDGDTDLFVTNFADDDNTLYANRGDGTFVDVTFLAGLGGAARPYLGWSTALVDVDLDGWLDLFVANGHLYPQLDERQSGLRYAQENLLFRNRSGHYEQIPARVGEALGRRRVTRGAAFGDVDNDGDVDVLTFNLNGPAELLRNDGGNRNNWIGFRLAGGPNNRDGLGARVEIETARGRRMAHVRRSYGYLSAHDPRVIFGLGREPRVPRVSVRWPSGASQVYEDLEGRTYYVLQEAQREAVALGGAPAAPAETAANDRTTEVAVQPGDEAVRVRRLLASVASGAARDTAQARVHYLSGVSLYREGRYEEALEAFEASVRLGPDDARVWHSLGVTLYAGLGRYDDSRLVLSHAAALDSSLVVTRELLGVVLLRLNRPREAAAALREGARIDPALWTLRYRLGLAWKQAGEPDSADAALQMATKLAPWAAMPHLHLARLYEELGRELETAREREAFVRLQPAEAEETRNLQRLEADPEDTEARYRLGLVYFEQRRFGEADLSFRQVLADDPDHAGAGYGLGAVYHRDGRLDEAAVAYRRVLEADSTQVEVWNDLGQVYHQLGRMQWAEAAYRTALRQSPRLSLAQANLGALYADTGRPKEAAEAFRAALRVDSTLVIAQQGLQRLGVSGAH